MQTFTSFLQPAWRTTLKAPKRRRSTRRTQIGKNKGEDELVKKLVVDFSADDHKVSRPISKQLAEIINRRWASKLDENKVKETVQKYNRPENC